MIQKDDIYYIIALQAIALIIIGIALYRLWKKTKPSDQLDLIDLDEKVKRLETDLKGQIQTLNKTAFEWYKANKKAVEAMDKVTIKAKPNEAGELIITSPDGTTIIDEFKLNK